MNDREVAEYLLANPEFFAEHAEMLATIKLANPHGKAAVSLQERQMEMLREKNKHLERRLAELLRYGHENDSIASKFSRWTTRVMAERDPYAREQILPTQPLPLNAAQTTALEKIRAAMQRAAGVPPADQTSIPSEKVPIADRFGAFGLRRLVALGRPRAVLDPAQCLIDQPLISDRLQHA